MSDRDGSSYAQLAAILVPALLCGDATRAGDDVPEAAFLEYLGSWEGSDSDWMLFEEGEVTPAGEDDAEVRNDPAQPDEESQEQDGEV